MALQAIRTLLSDLCENALSVSFLGQGLQIHRRLHFRQPKQILEGYLLIGVFTWAMTSNDVVTVGYATCGSHPGHIIVRRVEGGTSLIVLITEAYLRMARTAK